MKILWINSRRNLVLQGKARQGKERQGKERKGNKRKGKARQGKARQGKARQGKERQGNNCKVCRLNQKKIFFLIYKLFKYSFFFRY